MDISKAFTTSPEKEKEGIRVELGEGAVLIVARVGTPAYNRLVEKLFAQHKRTLDMKNEAAEELNNDLMAQVMAKTVLKGWEGVEQDGQPLLYNYENAVALLKIKDFRALVLSKANDYTLYKAAVDEDIAGN